MATSGSSLKPNFSDITDCPICLEVIKNAKCLPCIHTFCLVCLQNCGRDKNPGEKMACPLCREEFTVPVGGFEKLRTNFFIERLLDMSIEFGDAEMKQKETEAICDVCREEGQDASAAVAATGYCTDCDQDMCAACCSRHQRQKVSVSHKIITSEEKKSSQVFTNRRTYCEKHEGKPIELYCYDCKLPVCLMCFAIHHTGHKCSDLKESSELSKKQLKDKQPKLIGYAIAFQNELQQLSLYQDNFLEKTSLLEKEMHERCDEIKKMADAQLNQLTQKLCVLKEEQINKVSTRKEDIKKELAVLASYRRYSAELIEKGSACDISSSANVLLARADEFEAKVNEVKISTVEVSFEPSNRLTTVHDRLIGLIHVGHSELQMPGMSPDQPRSIFSRPHITGTPEQLELQMPGMSPDQPRSIFSRPHITGTPEQLVPQASLNKTNLEEPRNTDEMRGSKFSEWNKNRKERKKK